jgi:hypothetical protein
MGQKPDATTVTARWFSSPNIEPDVLKALAGVRGG